MGNTVFREKTMDKISSPEQLTDYLRVTNPGIWVILAAVVLLLGALLAWSAVGTLETTADAKAIIQDHTAQVVTVGTESGEVRTGMPLRIASREYIISNTDTDEYGRTVASAETDLPDGAYDAEIVVEQIRPIEFLLKGR